MAGKIDVRLALLGKDRGRIGASPTYTEDRLNDDFSHLTTLLTDPAALLPNRSTLVTFPVVGPLDGI